MNEFDLIKMIELKKQQRSTSLSPKQGLSVYKHLLSIDEKIDKLCDCRYPDGTSTWTGEFFGSMCRFCGRNDY